MSGSSPVLPETTLSLSVPTEGLHAQGVVLRFPELDDVDWILPAFTDPELREAGNLPAFSREQLLASLEDLPDLAEHGRLLALAAADAETGEIVGGARSITSTRSGGSSRSATSSCRLPVVEVSRRRSRECSPSMPSPSASSASPPT